MSLGAMLDVLLSYWTFSPSRCASLSRRRPATLASPESGNAPEIARDGVRFFRDPSGPFATRVGPPLERALMRRLFGFVTRRLRPTLPIRLPVGLFRLGFVVFRLAMRFLSPFCVRRAQAALPLLATAAADAATSPLGFCSAAPLGGSSRGRISSIAASRSSSVRNGRI